MDFSIKAILQEQMPDSSSHMAMNHQDQTPDLLLVVIFILGLLILAVIVIFFYYFYNRISVASVKEIINETPSPDPLDNGNTLNSSIIDGTFKETRKEPVLGLKTRKEPVLGSIDEQYYQRKQIIRVLTNSPEGIIQSKIPDLTNLSKATVSRRLTELFEDGVIEKIPTGRTNLIRLVN